MAISRDTQNQLEKGNFEALEADWLARIGQDPTDLDYFVGVARALSGNGEDKRARVLLELLDEQLRGGRWPLGLRLLQRAGHLLLPADKMHSAVVSTLEKMYGGQSNFKALS